MFTEPLVVIVLSVCVTSVLLSLLAWRARRGRAWGTLPAAVTILTVAWIANLGLIESDYRDADGLMDCWPSCSGFQDLLRTVFFTAPPLTALLGLVSLSVLLAARLRGRSTGAVRSS